MTMKLLALVVALAAGLAPLAARAQPRPPAAPQLATELEALRVRVDELSAGAAAAGAAAEQAQALAADVAALRQRVDELAGRQASIPDAREQLDRLAQRADALEEEIRVVVGRVAELERPGVSTGAVGGAGVGYGDGFTAATADGAYGLSLSGYLQTRLELALAEELDDVVATGLRVRRARVGLGGWLGSDRLRFKLMLDAAAAPALLDFFVDYRVGSWLVVRAGQTKLQFTRSFITSSTRLVFPERPEIVERFRYDRDPQLAVQGVLWGGRVGYYAALSNGAGPNVSNDNIDFAFSAHAEVAVVGARVRAAEGDVEASDQLAVTVGASAVADLHPLPDRIPGVVTAPGMPAELDTDVDGDGDRDNVRVTSLGVDAALRYRGLGVEAEWLLRVEDWGTIIEPNPELRAALDAIGGSGSQRLYQAFYAQASYMLLPRRLMVAARGGHGRLPLLGLGGRPSGVQPASRVLELGALVQLYDDAVGGRALGLAYDFRNYNARAGDDDPEADKQHRVVIETQLRF
jgi:hypothetical protein